MLPPVEFERRLREEQRQATVAQPERVHESGSRPSRPDADEVAAE
jgi:hypothetical protein